MSSDKFLRRDASPEEMSWATSRDHRNISVAQMCAEGYRKVPRRSGYTSPSSSPCYMENVVRR